MKTPARRGRPIVGDAAKTKVIRLRVTPMAKCLYETLAVQRGVSLSKLIDDMLRDAIREMAPLPKELE